MAMRAHEKGDEVSANILQYVVEQVIDPTDLNFSLNAAVQATTNALCVLLSFMSSVSKGENLSQTEASATFAQIKESILTEIKKLMDEHMKDGITMIFDNREGGDVGDPRPGP